MARTFGTPPADETDQLKPPAELMERDPDPYGEADSEPIDVAAIVAGEPDIDKPEVIVDAEVAKAPGTEVAVFERFDVTKDTSEVWPYDYLEFEGDKLGIRLPTRQALAAFSLASSKYVSLGVKNDLTGLFIARHLSQESYGRVFSRLMDPDDATYTVETVGELFNAIVTAAIESDTDD